MRSSEDLPAPLRPVTSKRLAGGDRKAEPGKHLAAAADAEEAARLKPHRLPPLGPGRLGCGRRRPDGGSPENPAKQPPIRSAFVVCLAECRKKPL